MKSQQSPAKKANHHSEASVRDRDEDRSWHGRDTSDRNRNDDRRHDDHRRDDNRRDNHDHRDNDHRQTDCVSDHRSRGGDRSDCRHDDRSGQSRNDSNLDIDVDRHGKWLKIDLDLDTKFGSIDVDLKIDARLLQPDTTLMTTLIGGEGNAVGDATLVDAEIFSRLVDLGSVAIAFGSASFAATAVSDGNLAFTTTETFAEVSGADFVFTFTEKTSESDFVDGALVARETSKVSFVAVDFEDFDLPEGPVLVSTNRAEYLDCECSDGCVEQIEGNVAQLSVDAAATSAATQVDVASSVLTVQDQLSSVSALATSAFADASFS